jgi:glycosyltransferase involved in cell wall biosynthesis
MATSLASDSITVFFPIFNDQETVESLVIKALQVLPTLTADYEILLIDDGSTDASGAIADRLAQTIKQLTVIHHPNNQGYGAALRTGFNNASKDLIFYTDGDGQYDVNELALLVPLMTEGVDVVNGYKIKRHDKSSRKVSGAIYNMLAHRLFQLPISDVDCDFRLLRRSAIGRISLDVSSGAICVELVRKLSSAGCIFREVPVHHYPRPHGRSQFFTPRRVARTLFDLWVLLLSASLSGS